MIKEIARFNICPKAKSVGAKQVICRHHILSFYPVKFGNL